ncbi:Protein gamma response 1 [Apostasia shenzhenica]|uniref:Protein gamma response 1 n=1 Tax=Apostasia shenzhenica TaxID=1088818 RepID=A0A2I0B523_9ASPA|nr:Protein gamma response 1 [Apostasia shenzhenica]
MENDDSQYLCQFTSLIVDAVEELAVRISQIEFVCRQRFPDLQTLSQFIQKKVIGSRNARELEWRKKEDALLQEIQKLQLERQHSKEQITHLVQSVEQTKQKLIDSEQLLSRHEFDKQQLLEQLGQKNSEIAETMDAEKKLMEQIELKDQKIIAEQSKRKSLFEEFNKLKTNYKELKSQYSFLICKLGNEKRNMPSTERMQAEKISPKPPEFAKPSSSASSKQASSSWRNTRIRQEPGNRDPHDDFLDTPMEIVKNLSDVETQEPNAETLSKKHSVFVSGKAEKGFRFVETVRRKAERENLVGVECQQCRKFYDAVLPDGGKDDDGSTRCEHHDGVSRHRYRFAPPSTPEGFWNIGFDSDL